MSESGRGDFPFDFPGRARSCESAMLDWRAQCWRARIESEKEAVREGSLCFLDPPKELRQNFVHVALATSSQLARVVT
jgi:hypothetical protein